MGHLVYRVNQQAAPLLTVLSGRGERTTAIDLELVAGAIKAGQFFLNYFGCASFGGEFWSEMEFEFSYDIQL